MTAEALVRHGSPWLTVWFKPRRTIERIVASDPRRHLWFLAALMPLGNLLTFLPMPQATRFLLDWRVILAALVLLPIMGMIGLYIQGFCFKWIGRMFGGRAPSPHLRAAIGWGFLPMALGGALTVLLVAVSGYASPGLFGPLGASPLIDLIVSVAAIWGTIAVAVMLARVQNFGIWRGATTFVFGLIVSMIALGMVFALPIRAFVIQPFNIPSGAMMPTLLVGDYLFASKFAYGYSRYSLPLWQPPISGRLFASEPQRGDVAIFRLPSDDRVDYVKRVIGLPGERIRMISGVVHINGEPVKRERMEDFTLREGGRERQVLRYQETLPGGVTHETLDLIVGSDADDTQEFQIPAGHYFMLGDNRDNSLDSRFFGGRGVGFVPFENFVGRADLIFISTSEAPRLVR
jgi:signal peptidase I